MNETIQKHSTNNTKHGKYKYTYYQNTHTLQNPPTHPRTHARTQTHTDTLQNKLQKPQYNLKQTQYKIYPNEIVTI
jgi:hypothetical protein